MTVTTMFNLLFAAELATSHLYMAPEAALRVPDPGRSHRYGLDPDHALHTPGPIGA